MKYITSFILALSALILIGPPLQAQQIVYPQSDGGGIIGGSPSQGIGFHGAADTPQRHGVAQNALATTSGTGAFNFSAQPTAQVYASGTLTLPVIPSAGDSVIVGSSTYTFQSAFSGTTNQVLIASDPADCLENLIGAILYSNSGAQQSGVTYQLSGTTANANARAVLTQNGAALIAYALSPGTGGNSIATTSNFSSGSNSWGASTLTGGAAGGTAIVGTGTYTFAAWLNPAVPNLVLASGSIGSAANLAAAINAAPGLAGIAYSSPTVSSTFASASVVSGTQVFLTEILGGTNAVNTALAKSDSAITLSSGSMTGGAQFTDTNAEANLLNEIRAALVQKGLIKGGQ